MTYAERCDVCGQPATVETCDVVECEPVPDEHGRLWATWEAGDRHRYCAAHERPPKRTYLPTHTPEEIARREADETWIVASIKGLAMGEKLK